MFEFNITESVYRILTVVVNCTTSKTIEVLGQIEARAKKVKELPTFFMTL